ncbi:hypothetical protein BRC91_05390 [Halobacteriales archaeon QS_4_62_28]|nr:MAG: hypothetical protein BRC91_05390 [Halobacteriales archaeon QS_4_62_28]
MSIAKAPNRGSAYVIEEPVATDGSLTVRDPATDTVYHVVDFADPLLEEKLANRPAGRSVRLELTPADPEGLDWVVTRLLPGAPLAL